MTNFLNAGDTFMSDSTLSDMFADVTIDDDLVYGHTTFQSEGEKIVRQVSLNTNGKL